MLGTPYGGKKRVRKEYSEAAHYSRRGSRRLSRPAVGGARRTDSGHSYEFVCGCASAHDLRTTSLARRSRPAGESAGVHLYLQCRLQSETLAGCFGRARRENRERISAQRPCLQIPSKTERGWRRGGAYRYYSAGTARGQKLSWLQYAPEIPRSVRRRCDHG